MQQIKKTISIICAFAIIISLFPCLCTYAIEESNEIIKQTNEHFTSVQSGSQDAVSGNLNNPLSAWKLTNATYKSYSFSEAVPYSIRLEELYYGDEAKDVILEENPFNDKPTPNQQWILMKFYLKNNGTEPITASNIFETYNSLYTSNGASMIIKDIATFSGNRRNMTSYDLSLEGGASGYFWFGFLTEKEQGLPFIKLYNGFSDSEYKNLYTWINTSPDYSYNPNASSNNKLDIPAVSAVNGNFKNPLSAWSMTYAKTAEYGSSDTPYYIRLEEMYTGNEANTLVATENQFNDKPEGNQQWILMKFYLGNAGTESITASEIIRDKSFYSSSGTSMSIKDTASLSGERRGMERYDLKLEGGADGYFWYGILVEKDAGLPYIKIENGYNKAEFKTEYCWLNTDSSYKYIPSQDNNNNNNQTTSSIKPSGIYCSSTSPSIIAGMVIDNKSDIKNDIEYQWLVCDESTGSWTIASDWTKNNEWMNYTPTKSGNYIFLCKARIVGIPDSEESASFGTPYTKQGGIKQICQMPYWGEGGGYLIGFESYENPNQEYQYEMFVMDLSLLAAGSPTPWVHATGKIKLQAGNTPEDSKTMWTIWQPEYGYYLTLFRLYDKNGNMIDEVPYGFANAY